MHDEHLEELNDLLKVRRAKLAKLQEMQVQPFAWTFERDITAQEVIDRFEELQEKTVSLAGRIMALRSMGKAAFAHIMDASARIQIYVRRDQVGDQAYDIFELSDIGDIVGVTGTVYTTRTGEITIFAQKFELLTKSLRPMPVVKERVEDGQKLPSTPLPTPSCATVSAMST